MYVADVCPWKNAVGIGVNEKAAFGFCIVRAEDGLVETCEPFWVDFGWLRYRFNFRMQGFAEEVFNGFGVNFFCGKKSYRITVLGKSVGDGYCNEFSAAQKMQSRTKNANLHHAKPLFNSRPTKDS